MAKDKLNALTVKALVQRGAKGRTGDGGGLYIDVRGAGVASWTYRFMVDGRAREMGLGRYPDVDLASARRLAAEQRALKAQRIDPLAHRRATAAALAAEAEAVEATLAAQKRTFKLVAGGFMEAKGPEWSNAKHAKQWQATLKAYVYPQFGDVPVAEVAQTHVLAALKPIWLAKPETAVRVRQRIEAILDFAAVQGWRPDTNPARWRGRLEHALAAPDRFRTVRHHPALPYGLLPDFMAELRKVEGLGALALRFAILTAARSSEVRLATWGEIDLQARQWRIPAGRMKAKRAHDVPLSAEALAVLAQAKPFRVSDEGTDLVFPGADSSRPLSDMTLAAVIKRLNKVGEKPKWVDAAAEVVVPHGFRSTFRDWCAETRPEASDVVEMALAHAIQSATEAAYRRGDMFGKRAILMDAWGQYCRGAMPANVDSMHRARR
ncbi:tyrosine-type recombinase/integrase [Phenylobacterium conjunctum]|uniref:Tyrosine-type recombinase/integrase n=1 Tax=Phenylobacterium conjunctum TaxID=1298959 RepID=A0ABW3T893_9CAUL